MTVQKKLIELGKELFDLKAEKEELEEKLKEINKRKEVLEVHEIPNLMQDTEITKFTIDGYGTIYKKNDVRAYIRVDNQEEAFDWLNENGHGLSLGIIISSRSMFSLPAPSYCFI